MNMPLEGITVVAIEQAVAAPYASSRLADAGARVIKIERPDGDFARKYDTLVKGNSAYFVWLNRGKESICLNLKDNADLAVLKKIIAQADVLLQNLKPGSLQKMGLGHTVLRAENPRLITCNITGFGETGDYAHLKAYDLIVQAEAGLCSITGTPDSAARVGVSVCDISAGMTAHSAILQALFHRERTGEGCNIDISLFDSIADWMNVPYLQRTYGQRSTPRSGLHHPSLAPYGSYNCANGTDIIFSVQSDREWVDFCNMFLERPDLTRNPLFQDNMARLENRVALDVIIADHFSKLTSEEVMKTLEATGLAYGRLNDIDALINHPHLRTTSVEVNGDSVSLIAPPQIYDNAKSNLNPVPRIGEHSDAIRAEFDTPTSEIHYNNSSDPQDI
ncbi:MAG: carnitine dehydratase [Alphaproteobacteria bacterium]|nr:MAG: carnitine dehydratase [Alphaproteobacteria bacterium]